MWTAGQTELATSPARREPDGRSRRPRQQSSPFWPLIGASLQRMLFKPRKRRSSTRSSWWTRLERGFPFRVVWTTVWQLGLRLSGLGRTEKAHCSPILLRWPRLARTRYCPCWLLTWDQTRNHPAGRPGARSLMARSWVLCLVLFLRRNRCRYILKLQKLCCFGLTFSMQRLAFRRVLMPPLQSARLPVRQLLPSELQPLLQQQPSCHC
mmetsp:Transcript_18417/g.51613  ORF Transcript_18417/g.51613 Transcript_18417/m.51613 type:complete len:209 (-) Transcript_18417:570-1196(-)